MAVTIELTGEQWGVHSRMEKYPKIETLYDRDKTTFHVTKELRMQEFGLVHTWHVTEKIHGTNIRIQWDGEKIQFAARASENVGYIPKELLQHLTETFTEEKLTAVFGCLGDEANSSSFATVTLYGEGCGPGIQKGGGNYAKEKTFVLFDVLVGQYWLEPESITDVATKLSIKQVPFLGILGLDDIHYLCAAGLRSKLARDNDAEHYHPAEGIIARTVPGLFTRYGSRLMFKLKTADFPQPMVRSI